MLTRLFGVTFLFIALAAVGSAQAPLGFPTPAIDISKFGARGDAQIQTCAVNLGPPGVNAVSCSTNVFYPSDVGKAVEIVGGGASSATLLTTIVAIQATTSIGSTCSTPPCPVARIAASPASSLGSTTVIWGTDNGLPLQAAADGCPPPSIQPTSGPQSITPFTSKGCVLLVPNAGASGTGDYMFGTGVTFLTQTSFEIRGMGNSGKWEQSQQAGVRFITAVPITIMQVNQIPVSTSAVTVAPNLGGFQLENITFADVSGNGSAIGGLLMNGVSEAVIAFCSFEGFNGQQAGAAPSTTALSYGMRATAFGAANLFNNNIVLLHDKGKDNSIWYDASDGAQDGPIVIGGDIFPTNTVSSAPATGPWTSTCIGIASTGVIRLYGTHFDVGSDHSGGTNTCIGMYPLGGGTVSGKFESSAIPATPQGTGIQVGPSTGTASGGSATLTTTNMTKSGNGYVSVSVQTSPNPVVAGQAVTISHTNASDEGALDGTFIVTSATSGSFTYDSPGQAYSPIQAGGTATGNVVFSLNVQSIFNHLVADVVVNAGAKNNNIVDYSSANGGTTVTDSGANDNVQVFSQQTAGNSTTFTGTLTVPMPSGGLTTGGGQIAYDPSVKVPHMYSGTADAKVPTFVATPATSDCVNWISATQIGDAGPCTPTPNNAVLMFSCIGAFTVNQTIVLFPGSNATVCTGVVGNATEVPLPFAGTLKNLYVKVGMAGVSGSGQTTVYRNGSSTAITCTTGTGTTCSDTSDTQTVAAGDTISIHVVTKPSDTLANMRVTVQLQ